MKHKTSEHADALHQSPVSTAPDSQCRRCGGPLRPGIAIEQTSRGTADFPGGEAITMSPGGPGHLIDCMKCAACGHSVAGDAPIQADR